MSIKTWNYRPTSHTVTDDMIRGGFRPGAATIGAWCECGAPVVRVRDGDPWQHLEQLSYAATPANWSARCFELLVFDRAGKFLGSSTTEDLSVDPDHGSPGPDKARQVARRWSSSAATVIITRMGSLAGDPSTGDQTAPAGLRWVERVTL